VTPKHSTTSDNLIQGVYAGNRFSPAKSSTAECCDAAYISIWNDFKSTLFNRKIMQNPSNF